MENLKNKIISIGFVIIIISVFIINMINKDKMISTSERRKLNQLPKITVATIRNGEVTKKWENYAVDQFIGRDFFRSIKAFYSLKIINQKDNNNLYEIDGGIYKMEYPLKTANLEKSAKKINDIYNKHLKNMNVYYSIIPDKSYYLKNDNHLKMDFNEIEKIMNENLKELQYIDISEVLTIEDFYKTDLHWKQEELQEVIEKITTELGLQNKNTSYEAQNLGDFYGTYYGQLGLKLSPDEMYILNNDIIENCKVYNYETQEITGVYNFKNSDDKYDVYLSGATPLITIENPNASTTKELLLFRDSFGSSVAPLLVDNYKKIILIDIRYMSSSLLDKYIEFDGQDVLFLYSALVLNSGVFR